MTSKLYKVLHLESTDVCNLACPACARETDPEFDKELHNHLSVEQIQKVFSVEKIKQLDKMFMCGNYGDPAAGKHTLEIYNYFRNINPDIVLGMNTNGALRTPNWWRQLARLLNQPRDFVVFSIDGLEDTNHVYRKNVSWGALIRNVHHFIESGGSAHWDMLVYKHNEHQVDACEQLARNMGFKWFRAKVSKRPLLDNLEYPVTWNRSQYQPGRIDCHALKEQSVYIDSQGRTSPCCWLGARQRNFIQHIEQVSSTWDTANPDPVFQQTCGIINNATNFENQWQKNIDLVQTTYKTVKTYNTDIDIV